MSWSEILFWLPLALTIPFATGTALIVRRKQPGWSRTRIALVAALPGCILTLLLAIWAYGHETSQPADLPDGGEAIAMLFVLITSVYMAVVFTVGAIAALVCLGLRQGDGS